MCLQPLHHGKQSARIEVHRGPSSCLNSGRPRARCPSHLRRSSILIVQAVVRQSTSQIVFPLYPHPTSSSGTVCACFLMLPRFARLCSPENIAVPQRHVYIIITLAACTYRYRSRSRYPLRRFHLAKARSTSPRAASYYRLVLSRLHSRLRVCILCFGLSYVCHPPSSRTCPLRITGPSVLVAPLARCRHAHHAAHMTACRAAIGPQDPHHPPTPASSPTHAPGSISPSLPRSNTTGASVPSMPPGVHNAVPCTQSPSRAPPAPATATETLG